MQRARLGLVAASLFAGATLLYGQGAPPASQRGGGPGGGRGPGVVSPEVSADRKITLRFVAPNATTVTASGELDGQPHPMTKGDNGVWSVTIGPLPLDIYTYSFNVDGVTAL